MPNRQSRLPNKAHHQREGAVPFARMLRRSMNTSEYIVWEWLRNRRTGFKFRRQVPIGRYTVDFYCAEAMVVVEVDGEQHALQERYDAERDGFLNAQGLAVLRIPSIAIFDSDHPDFFAWLEKIINLCESRCDRRGIWPVD